VGTRSWTGAAEQALADRPRFAAVAAAARRLKRRPLCVQLLASNALPAENESMSVSIEEILNLSVKKRLELIEEIWDSIASSQEAIPLTSAQRRELDRRRSVHRADPSAAVPWTEVRSRLQKRKK
jgi:putative addiction module component (TIGR02574 family)